MSYLQNNMSNNVDSINAPSWNSALKMRTYLSTDDTLAQIKTAGYFNDAVADYNIQIHDVMFVAGTDADVDILEINALTPNVTVVSVVGTASIPDGSITTPKLADLAVTTAKIAALAVTTAKIADINVTTAKIADVNVTTAKIADLAVDNSKIAAATLGAEKLEKFTPGNTDPATCLMQVLVIPNGNGGDTNLTLTKTGMVITRADIQWIDGGTTGDGVQLFKGMNALTENFNTELPATSFRTFTNLNIDHTSFAESETVTASVTDGGGADTPALRIYLYGYPIA